MAINFGTLRYHQIYDFIVERLTEEIVDNYSLFRLIATNASERVKSEVARAKMQEIDELSDKIVKVLKSLSDFIEENENSAEFQHGRYEKINKLCGYGYKSPLISNRTKENNRCFMNIDSFNNSILTWYDWMERTKVDPLSQILFALTISKCVWLPEDDRRSVKIEFIEQQTPPSIRAGSTPASDTQSLVSVPWSEVSGHEFSMLNLGNNKFL